MKFITESELRDIYRIHPFTTYEAEPGSRLTPGARQFLADRGIKSFDDAARNNGVKGHYYNDSDDELKTAAQVIKQQLDENAEKLNKPRRVPVITIQGEDPIEIGSVKSFTEEEDETTSPGDDGKPAAGSSSAEMEKTAPGDIADSAAQSPGSVAAEPAATGSECQPCEDKRLLLMFKQVKADFLLAGQELLKLNVLLDQSLMTLCEQLTAITKALQKGSALPQDLDPELGGFSNAAEFSREQKDPFEVTSFHMQLPNGREILLLNKLRCSMQLLAEEVNEKAAEDRAEYMVVSAKLNQIINTISHLISNEIGGN
ncbi:MAG: hypothetical protein ACOYJI_06780 [Anaerovoracaceae bacterium]|jgi:hypothetical protein